MKQCITCVFYQKNRYGYDYKPYCKAFKHSITGEPVDVFCLTAREPNGKCGPDARLYRPKLNVFNKFIQWIKNVVKI